MRIQQIPINKIKPDPNQPRKFFDLDRVSEMAKSILTEGVINPIEVDKSYKIITGEIRWRAAKEAGFKEMPCRVFDMNGRERFRRQVIENIHHNTMTTWETAGALEKLYTSGVRSVDSLRKLAEEIGKSKSFIEDHLNLLKESEPVKEWLKKKDSKYSLIRDANKAPEEFRDVLKKKIVKGKINKYDTVLEMVGALKRTPERAEKLFGLDFHKPALQTVSDIHRISPPPESAYRRVRAGTSIVELITYLIQKIEKTKFKDLLESDQIAIRKLVEELKSFVPKEDWIEGEIIGDSQATSEGK